MKHINFRLFLVVLCAMIGGRVSAQDFQCGDLFYNVLSEADKTVKVTGCCDRTITSVSIPETVTNESDIQYKVTAIGEGAFYNCENLESVTIPASVTTVGESAFSGCTSLETVSIPKDGNLNTIEDFAFDGCESLTSFTLPDNVKKIGQCAFQDCSLEEIAIPEGLSTLGDTSFGFNRLKTVTIPASVTDIDGNPFAYCFFLTSIEVKEGNQNYCDENGVLYTKDKSVLIGCPTAKPGNNFNFPKEVKTIGDYAFCFNQNLTSIVVPEGITTIGEAAFYACQNLASVSLPASLQELSCGAFCGCGILSFTIDENNQVYASIENILFSKDKKILYENYDPNLTHYSIPTGVETIGESAFDSNENLESVDIPEGVVEIGYGAFWGCSNIKSIVVPNSVTTIGDYAFSSCGIESISIGNGVDSIGRYAFDCCENLTSIVIPNSVKTIGDYAFSGSGIKTAVIGNSVETIEPFSFGGCSNLTTLTLGSGVKSIGKFIVNDCPNLTSVYSLSENVPVCNFNAFDNEYASAPTLYVPVGTADAYKDAAGWYSFAGNIQEQAFAGDVILSFATAEWATLTLPFSCDIPEGLSVYTVTGHKGNVLTMEEVKGSMCAFTPYLVRNNNSGTTSYTLSGDGMTTDGWYTQGVMAGVTTEQTASEGDYVLQLIDGKLGFYYLDASDYQVGANRAVLRLPAEKASKVKALYFNENSTTSINSVTSTEKSTVDVFTFTGQKVRGNVKCTEATRSLPAGIYMIGGRKVVVKP